MQENGVNKLYILTGKIHSGKTTALAEWLKNRDDSAGVLSPLVNRKRILLDIKSKDIRLFEVSKTEDSSDTVSIGKYKFDKAAFDWGNQRIEAGINAGINWLIVDEFGHIELDGNGFFNSVSMLIQKVKEGTAPNAIIVVRDYLIDEFIGKYELEDFQFSIVDKEKLNSLL